MKLSLNWLNEYVPVKDIDVKDFCDALTMSGSKVEGFEVLNESIKNVVVCKILKTEKHPDADRLTVCTVDIGKEEPIVIVTAATNMKEGDLVPVALHNSLLPTGEKITAGKLRGVMSYGMFCSIDELCLTSHDYPYANSDGLFILQEPCKPGDDIAKVLGLDDVVVEFEITPNRPDCLSVIGLARETAATFARPLNVSTPKVTEAEGKIEDYISIKVSSPDLCPRYSARVVKNVKIEPSPAWLRERLRNSGVRPINNIIDITNYVMLEYGQPMHAFDYACLEGKAIEVRRAFDNEVFVALNNEETVLSSDNLVIADGKKAVALAGVMGGLNSEITDDTKTVVFESANFVGSSVRKTSRKVGIRSESSGRFEKGLDSRLTKAALDRAVELVTLLGAGEVVCGEIDIDNDKKAANTIAFCPDWINAFLGTDISNEKMLEYLESVGIKYNEAENLLEIPSFRADIESKADIAEEVARFYGYNVIPTTLIRGTSTEGGRSELQKFEKKAVSCLTALGLNEITTYSFISPKYYDKINLPADSVLRNSVKILNPLGEDTSVMRTTALPSMLETVSRNINYRNSAASLFEVATVYLPNEDEVKLPEEKTVITLGIYGEGVDYYDIKGILEELAGKLGVKIDNIAAEKENVSYHPYRTAKLYSGDAMIALIGEVHPAVLANYGIDKRVFAAEIDFESLFNSASADKQYEPLPKFPASERDISVVCDEDVFVKEIENDILKASKNLLKEIKVFDVYRSEALGENKKSVSFSLSFRAPDRTLSDADVDAAMKKILKALNAKGIVLRS